MKEKLTQGIGGFEIFPEGREPEVFQVIPPSEVEEAESVAGPLELAAKWLKSAIPWLAVKKCI